MSSYLDSSPYLRAFDNMGDDSPFSVPAVDLHRKVLGAFSSVLIRFVLLFF